MSYHDLARLGVTFRPIDAWPGSLTQYRRHSAFSARLSETIGLLAREVRALNGRLIVLQLAITEGDLRNDGMPRASARPDHPGVILAFESRHGPLKFAVDTFTSWQDNLRAIALGMEALRKVDRYGVTKRGEQYTGWRALPPGPGDEQMTRLEAETLLAEYGGVREALRATHPDSGGDPEDFRRVMRAKELVA